MASKNYFLNPATDMVKMAGKKLGFYIVADKA